MSAKGTVLLDKGDKELRFPKENLDTERHCEEEGHSIEIQVCGQHDNNEFQRHMLSASRILQVSWHKMSMLTEWPSEDS